MVIGQQDICQPGNDGRLVNTFLRQIFREVADMPRKERDGILSERRISAGVRAELESLLRYDSASGESLTRRVSGVAQEALQWGTGSVSRHCGPYQLVRLLGSGGMGAVYLAERRDGEIEQKVAIKFLRSDADRPEWRDRFLRERQLLAYLNHASIARLLDAGHTDDGQPYLVMEYVDGVTIDEYAATLDLRDRLSLFLLVCGGVSHAHRHLIVHRDLKPSNILVDASGHPKLLDFGIAKLLDATADQTRTVERLLTPNYASPEQLRGDIQTTATDVYSLGAVLCNLLTGRPPREPFLDASNPSLPRDIGHILRKAMRPEPDERYTSVEAFANDVRAFLESRPVEARSGHALYRIRKFLRRYRVAVAAATITTASLSLGFHIANEQRGIAQTRSLQVRQLTNKVLALNGVAGGLHGSTKAMHDIVAMSKENLEALVAEARTDKDVAFAVVEGYSLLARAQGISIATHPGQRTQAEASLQKASIFVKPLLSANPDNRKALLAAARISHDRMILAQSDRRNDEALTEARKAAGYLDRFLQLGELSAAESDTASELFYDIALVHKNLHLADDGIRYARRSIEVSRSSPDAERHLSLSLSMLADLLRRTGDLEGALAAIREARSNLDKAGFTSETERRASWCRVLGREGKILGVAGGISLNRPDEAIPLFQRVFDLLEEWTQNNREDVWSRLLFVSVGTELGDTLRLRDPQRALEVYDHALRRLREVKNNAEARRGEAEILAGSAYALRSLNRITEAKDRIGTALRLLSETNDYPADRITPYSATHEALRAAGDHFSGTGQLQHALKVYEDLLERIMISEQDAQNDLPNALALSEIYGSLAFLYRRNGQHDRGRDFSALRLELWNHWDRKLPNNGFVRRQLASARNYESSQILLSNLASQAERRSYEQFALPDYGRHDHDRPHRLRTSRRNGLPGYQTAARAVWP